FNRRNQKSLSSLSEPVAFSLGFSYQLPALGSNRWARTVVGGWTFGGILRYASGLPIPVPLAQNNLSSLLFRPTFFNRSPGVPLFTKDLNCHCIDPNKDLVLNRAARAAEASGLAIPDRATVGRGTGRSWRGSSFNSTLPADTPSFGYRRPVISAMSAKEPGRTSSTGTSACSRISRSARAITAAIP